MVTVDIILPAFNPLPGWEKVVINRFLSLENQLPGFQLKLIIINDGSSKINEPDSIEQLKKNILNFQWIGYSANKGKGYALRKGVSASDSSLLVYTDIDWPYDQESMVGIIRALEKDADVVVAVRNDAYYGHLPLTRKIISRLLKKINERFLKLKVNDTQAGLKGFKKNMKEVFLRTKINRYLFDLEFIYLLSQYPNLKVKSYPATLRQDITFSDMNRKILVQESWNFLKLWFKSENK